MYSLEDEEASQKLLGRLLYEAAGQFYLDAARRRLSVHAERRSQIPELNARVAFKVISHTSIKQPQMFSGVAAALRLQPPISL